MKNIYRFDNTKFSIEELRTYINNNKKLLSLYNNLRKIIYVNNEEYKHVIYASSTSCTKNNMWIAKYFRILFCLR